MADSWQISVGGWDPLRSAGDRHSAERAVADIASELTCGHRVVIFPEGTTTRGPMPIKFRSRLFQAARQAGVPIVPIALSYHGAGNALVSYADDDQFISHLFRICGAPFICGRISVGKPLSPTNQRPPSQKGPSSVSNECWKPRHLLATQTLPVLRNKRFKLHPKETCVPINLL